ncbi:tRNA (guanine-N-7) methyltransferase, Trmb type [Dillenia turbinata]|uniref:Phosphoglycerate kinase n=1 Tax=Dillenia turbinata TaxID=194707 RepID=A0AAN8W8W8_9MAGN
MMSQILNPLHFHTKPCLKPSNSEFHSYYSQTAFKFLRRRKHCYGPFGSCLRENREVIDDIQNPLLQSKAKFIDGEFYSLPPVRTLREFPKEELFAKIVLVRFDSAILLQDEQGIEACARANASFTIRYLYETGAKVILLSNWNAQTNSKLHDVVSVAEFLSSVLELKVEPLRSSFSERQSNIVELEKSNIILWDNLFECKPELANCSKFAKQLSSGVDIFVNEAFSQSHKILASTVGVASFCYASVAGFHFEQVLYQLKEATRTNKNPFVAIIGGGKLLEKAAALHSLASRCDGLVFVGLMAYQIMHACGLPVPPNLVEHAALKEASNLLQLARERGVPLLYPKDFLCISGRFPNQSRSFPAHEVLEGWVPVDLGPNTFTEISSLLLKCKKILWIGPVQFSIRGQLSGASKLVMMLDKLIQSNCDVTVIGKMACKEIVKNSKFVSAYNMFENASILWEFLKGRTLPGLAALDRGYPFEINWSAAYTDPVQPLVVDIGSGNGLFLFGMARRRKDLNFLGLEMNEKLVQRCLDSIHRSGIENGYFIATNATSSFRSIVSSYPGELILVSIQCPNPDFNKPDQRWRMVQRSLVEAVADLLVSKGKVSLQSDVEAVAKRMVGEFMKYRKGKLAVMNEHADATHGSRGWLKENPFGMRSDWEQHVLDRGAPMYRLMLSKVD